MWQPNFIFNETLHEHSFLLKSGTLLYKSIESRTLLGYAFATELTYNSGIIYGEQNFCGAYIFTRTLDSLLNLKHLHLVHEIQSCISKRYGYEFVCK